MIMPGECFGKGVESAGFDFQSARSQFMQGFCALNQVQRRTLLSARFSQQQRAIGKIESCQSEFAPHLRPRLAPMQSSRNHQVQHQPEAIFEPEANPLADSTQSDDLSPVDPLERRQRSSQQERASDANFDQSLAQNPTLQPLEINCYVREFWHKCR